VSQATAIEWTDATWNPVHGCSKVSPGCAHCYAETLSRRYKQTPAPWTPANASENVILKPHKLAEPLRWREPRRVFVNSMSDLFHELVPDDYIWSVFGIMRNAPQHTFQVLTKRPERMREFLRDWHPAPNVWLGVSIENRRFVHRADLLRQTPAAVRFISAEPLLGPLVYDAPEAWLSGDDGYEAGWSDRNPDMPPLDLTAIDWLIVGGESGPGHRRLDLEWVRDLRDACMATRPWWGETGPPGTAFFVKQLGGARPGTKLEDLPSDLRIREFPLPAVPA
jgi:protein gp37